MTENDAAVKNITVKIFNDPCLENAAAKSIMDEPGKYKLITGIDSMIAEKISTG